jgi:hypothetical protein
MTNVLEAAGETAKTASAGGLSVTLDIAALANALFWPAVLLLVFLTYREQIPGFVKAIGEKISKVEFSGVSIELAKAKAFTPDWSETAGGLDLRRKAVALEINDSYTETFRAQLLEEGTWEYAEINLGEGYEWLTSRLYIMAIVFARMKGIKCLVFVQTAGKFRRRLVCIAEPEKVRWALAKRYPWLEEAYSAAYSAVINFPNAAPQNLADVPPINQAGVIVTNEGRLGSETNATDPWPSVSLIQQFVARVQSAPAPPRPDQANWVYIASQPQPREEHARWINSIELEDLLGKDCHKTHIESSELAAKDATKHLQKLLAVPERFIAVTGPDMRFEYLIDRRLILEQLANQFALHIAQRSKN